MNTIFNSEIVTSNSIHFIKEYTGEESSSYGIAKCSASLLIVDRMQFIVKKRTFLGLFGAM